MSKKCSIGVDGYKSFKDVKHKIKRIKYFKKDELKRLNE